MRLFLFVLALSSQALLAAPPDCVSTDVDDPSSIPACTHLVIDTPIDLRGLSGPALEIDVNGDVEINADIILDGLAGGNIAVATSSGGVGGPGAENGGGTTIGFPDNGGDGANGNGLTPVSDDPLCGNGGGGGGLYEQGQSGSTCAAATTATGVGGNAFAFPGTIRGGFGGGAGAFSTPFEVGAGGGGGGGLYIHATGTITIKKGVRISARGGNGGNATNKGGPGGGGSGGIIWIHSDTNIVNKGIFDVTGGNGGTSPQPRTSTSQNGNGAGGIFRIQIGVADINDGTGIGNFTSSGRKLSSDISCGTIGVAKENKNETFQMLSGFVMALMMGALIKTLFRAPKKLLVKSARQS
ncbi:hypothetical protein [Peredibacter starrii]|uniref:Uncharacterized protein n=1 Tax=Peredibacter starrii TaxID=28202 RepID=A0AAX4HSL7_9BACT|nr:hypothetical protein [Peredibacter starrii]WPU66185.1 hypothetical protein SOO65_05445 [Peredibacter starrii]